MAVHSVSHAHQNAPPPPPKTQQTPPPPPPKTQTAQPQTGTHKVDITT